MENENQGSDTVDSELKDVHSGLPAAQASPKVLLIINLSPLLTNSIPGHGLQNLRVGKPHPELRRGGATMILLRKKIVRCKQGLTPSVQPCPAFFLRFSYQRVV